MKKTIIICTSVVSVLIVLATVFLSRQRTVCGIVSLNKMTDATVTTISTGLHGNYDVYLSPTNVHGYGMFMGNYVCEAQNISPNGTFEIRSLIQSYDEHGDTPTYYSGGSMTVNWIAIQK
jgi:hypothetical protein